MSIRPLLLLSLTFMDSGRVADEFEPSLRRRLRLDILLLLSIGVLLLVGGIVTMLLFQQYLIAAIPLAIGSLLLGGAIILWWGSR